MLFRPVQQRQLKLCHAGQQVGVIPALPHLGGHIGADGGNAGVIGVFFIGNQQIQLGVFLHLHAQLIQALDGGVAGKEVLRAGAKGDDLEIFHTDDGAGNGNELRHLVGQLLGGTHGVFRNIALEVAHPQIVGAVEHPAVGVAPAVDHVAVALGGGHKHTGAVKVFGDEGLRRFGAEVAQKNRQRIAAGGTGIRNGIQHILFVFHGDRAFVHRQAPFGTQCRDGLPSVNGQRDGETIAGNRDDAQFDLGNVLHG